MGTGIGTGQDIQKLRAKKKVSVMQLNEQYLGLEGPSVMGILNVTPDSFFSGSRKFLPADIAARVKEISEQGAVIVDIGGYSTRPGAPEVTPEEELRRVILGLEIVREVAPELVISIDTFRAGVAEGVLSRFGGCIINDISAGELDPAIIDVVAGYGSPYIAMHMRGTPADMQQYTRYGNVAHDVGDYLIRRAEYLKIKGVKDIILDPGFGFAKTTEQNYELLAGLGDICKAGYPVLTGLSRKSMIYKVLGTTPGESLAGTAALNWECLRKGASVLRAHDVKEACDIVKLFNFYRENGA